MSQTAPEHPSLRASHRLVTRIVLRFGLLIGVLVYLGAVIWLIEEAVVAGARLLDDATSGAVSKAVANAFEFMKDRFLPIRPAR